MAITEVVIERGGLSGAGDHTQKRMYEEVYRVRSNSIADGPRTVASAIGIPTYFATHSEDPLAFVVNKQARLREDQIVVATVTEFIWIVTVNYSSDLQDVCPTESDNPLDRPALVVWDNWTLTKPVEKATLVDDQDNELEVDVPIATAVGEKFDPGLLEELYPPMVRIQQNVAEWDPVTAMQYLGKGGAVNLDEFQLDGFTIPAGAAKIVKFIGQPKYAGTEVGCQKYYELHAEILFQESWVDEVLHQGWRHFEGDGQGVFVTNDDGSKFIRIATDDDSRSEKRPVLLRVDGTKLAEGEDPNYRRYLPRNRQPFAPLNLPTGE